MHPRGSVGDKLRIWTESDWAGDVKSRKACSGGYIQRNGGGHWSKTQTNVALSSREAGLNRAVEGISEGIGVHSALKQLFSEERGMFLSVDASACKGMLLRASTGKVKHLSTKQLWAQRAIHCYGV